MKQIKVLLITCLITFSIIFSGCGTSKNLDEGHQLVSVDISWGYVIYYDRYTKVMYIGSNNGGIRPMYNSDGSLLLWEK